MVTAAATATLVLDSPVVHSGRSAGAVLLRRDRRRTGQRLGLGHQARSSTCSRPGGLIALSLRPGPTKAARCTRSRPTRSTGWPATTVRRALLAGRDHLGPARRAVDQEPQARAGALQRGAPAFPHHGCPCDGKHNGGSSGSGRRQFRRREPGRSAKRRARRAGTRSRGRGAVSG